MCVCMQVRVHVGGVGVVVEFREQTSGVILQVPFIVVVVDTGTLIGPELTKQAKLTAQ